MSLLSEYEQNTRWKYEPIRGRFQTHEQLPRKVHPDGSYVPFAGSTVVFRPDRKCRRIIQLMQSALHRNLEGTGMLAEPLPADTVHMTLHDLISPEMCVSGPENDDQYDKEVNDSIEKAAAAAGEIRREYSGRRLRMAADRIVNMVSKSLVLLLKPQTEQDCELLLEMHRRFDSILKLPYPFVPHMTLAYYRPGTLDGGILGAAVNAAQINPDHAPVFEFHPEGLTAQRFTDMKTYTDIPVRICFCCDGGLNRSVMAANILNHLAKKRGLPVTGEARSAYTAAQGRQVPDQVWQTLEDHGIIPDRTYDTARYLTDDEISHFTALAGMTVGAMDRVACSGLPEGKACGAGRFFFGVRDPEYGEITYEQAFGELLDRTGKYLDSFAKEYSREMKK